MASEYFDFLEQNVPSEGESNHDVPQNGLVNLTLRTDAECQVQCDGNFLVLLNANQITQVKAPVGQHILQFISTVDSTICVEKIVDFSEVNKNYLVLVSELGHLIHAEEAKRMKENEPVTIPFVAKLGGTGVYTGKLKDGKPDGKGKIAFDSGAYYEGDFKDGWRHGKGYFRDRRGFIYEGDFVEDMRTGYGKQTTPDGRLWEGEFLNGDVHGKARLTYSNGDTIEGVWIKGAIADQPCIYTWPNGDKLECVGYQNGPTGHAVFTYADGREEEQVWKHWKRIQKIPKKVWTNRFNPGGSHINGIYEGQTEHGVPDGVGRFECELFTYEGEFKARSWSYKGRRIGKDSPVCEDSTIYWAGEFSGKGIIKWNNGDMFEGEFESDYIKTNAPHTYTWANGDRITSDEWRGGSVENCRIFLKDGSSGEVYIKNGYWESAPDTKICKYLRPHLKLDSGTWWLLQERF